MFSVSIFALNIAFADNHGDKGFMLDEREGYLKYDEPKKGTANAKMLMEEGIIVMEILSPAWNFHGVDTAPNARSDIEKEQVQNETQRFMSEPNKFFRYEPSKYCSLKTAKYRTEQISSGEKQGKGGGQDWRAFDVRAEAIFGCAGGAPDKMAVDLFSAFPRLKELNVQMIINNADVRRVTLTPEKPVIAITPAAN